MLSALCYYSYVWGLVFCKREIAPFEFVKDEVGPIDKRIVNIFGYDERILGWEEKPELEVTVEDTIESPILESNPVVEPKVEQPVSFDNFLSSINEEQPKEEQPVLDIPVDPISYDIPNTTPTIETEPSNEEVRRHSKFKSC